jgi:hypothetical protein
LQVQQGQLAQARQSFDEARELLLAVLEDRPDLVEAEMLFASLLSNLAGAHAQEGNRERATAAFEQGRGQLQSHLEEEPDDLLARRVLVDLFNAQANMLEGFDDPRGAEAYHALALEQQRIVADHQPENEVERTKLSNMLWNQSDRCARRGEHARVEQIAAERMKRWVNRADELYYAAWELARAYKAVDLSPDRSGVEGLQESYLDRALDALEAAVAAGYHELAELESNQDMAPLRSTRRYADLVATLKSTSP